MPLSMKSDNVAEDEKEAYTGKRARNEKKIELFLTFLVLKLVQEAKREMQTRMSAEAFVNAGMEGRRKIFGVAYRKIWNNETGRL